jgi:hypothetical protein
MDGLSGQAAWMDPNRGNLIYERQVLAELLEYGYMLHRSLYHRVAKFGTTAEVVSVRKEISQLQRKMREASHSGEIRELLENGWKKLGLPNLISEIDAALRLRESETRSIEALRSTRVGWALTVVFGFVAVPTLARPGCPTNLEADTVPSIHRSFGGNRRFGRNRCPDSPPVSMGDSVCDSLTQEVVPICLPQAFGDSWRFQAVALIKSGNRPQGFV